MLPLQQYQQYTVRTGCTDRNKGGEKEHRENIPFWQHVSVTVPIPEQERGTRRWEREETPLLGLPKPSGSAARFQPTEVQVELRSFLFLAMAVVIPWDFEPLWEQAWYLCPTKTSRFAFVSAGRSFYSPAVHYWPGRPVLKLRMTGGKEEGGLRSELSIQILSPLSAGTCLPFVLMHILVLIGKKLH